MQSPPIFAAIDLGSNSFHMLLVRQVAGSIQIVDKIKRKVRLASGLDQDNNLDCDAMLRGWNCLSLFAERLQDIHPENIRVVGTATMRLAKNINVFLEKAEKILQHKIEIISGEEEAKIIFQGVAHTSASNGNSLVVDIGGASTEIIIGSGFEPIVLTSSKIGCVTWLNKYFKNQLLSQENFDNAIAGAKEVLLPLKDKYTNIGWGCCVGASGTIQALQEIMLAQGMDEIITLHKLKRLQKQAQSYINIIELDIDGLTLERALVFPSGLAILIAIFELFEIEAMTLAGGAIREGLVYKMMPDLHQSNIQQRTINSIQKRFYLDQEQNNLVLQTCLNILEQCPENWLPEKQALQILKAAANLHEIGLHISYKNAGEHNAYLIKNLDLPGFTHAQQNLLATILSQYKGNFIAFQNQHALSNTSAIRILQILRIAIILCQRRKKETIPKLKIKVCTTTNKLNILLPSGWLERHPLIAAALDAEIDKQNGVEMWLSINELTKIH